MEIEDSLYLCKQLINDSNDVKQIANYDRG